MSIRGLTVKQRIELHIISKNGCWITNYKGGNSRPRIFINGKHHVLARAAYEVYKGTIPEKMCVCHTCDNGLCINPDHLFLGSQLDNIADRQQKNRQAKGSSNGHAKLTESQVAQIRDLLAERKLTHRQIADKFGVNPSIICTINTGKSWTHVDGIRIGAKINPRRVNAKLDDDKVKQIKKLLAEGMSTVKIGQLFGVATSTIGSISRNQAWTHVNPD